MIFGLPLDSFLIIWLSIIAMITMAVLLPFIVRRFRPQHYGGFWRFAGELLKSPKNALMQPTGMLLGLLVIVLVFRDREMSTDTGQLLLIVALLVVLVEVALGWGLHAIERRRRNRE